MAEGEAAPAAGPSSASTRGSEKVGEAGDAGLNWVEKLRGECEPEHHWQHRREFLIRNAEALTLSRQGGKEEDDDNTDLRRLVSFSMVWANHIFLGCRYPPQVMEKVLDMAAGITVINAPTHTLRDELVAKVKRGISSSNEGPEEPCKKQAVGTDKVSEVSRAKSAKTEVPMEMDTESVKKPGLEATKSPEKPESQTVAQKVAPAASSTVAQKVAPAASSTVAQKVAPAASSTVAQKVAPAASSTTAQKVAPAASSTTAQASSIAVSSTVTQKVAPTASSTVAQKVAPTASSTKASSAAAPKVAPTTSSATAPKVAPVASSPEAPKVASAASSAAAPKEAPAALKVASSSSAPKVAPAASSSSAPKVAPAASSAPKVAPAASSAVAPKVASSAQKVAPAASSAAAQKVAPEASAAQKVAPATSSTGVRIEPRVANYESSTTTRHKSALTSSLPGPETKISYCLTKPSESKSENILPSEKRVNMEGAAVFASKSGSNTIAVPAKVPCKLLTSEDAKERQPFFNRLYKAVAWKLVAVGGFSPNVNHVELLNSSIQSVKATLDVDFVPLKELADLPQNKSSQESVVCELRCKSVYLGTGCGKNKENAKAVASREALKLFLKKKVIVKLCKRKYKGREIEDLVLLDEESKPLNLPPALRNPQEILQNNEAATVNASK
ncbi:CDKN2A-interacting protein isoform X2 [Hemicordylus capensis]|uniref:CDKN2A-interacting protein isoform X2 n=1 Tax=Hemicordylus capensis TaxID=884348 RepID=UPI002302DF45|nr:CDKN2A-interacting protein isoform X2 [Hemicordylus capensis]